MKKILLTTVVTLALSFFSVQADLLKVKHEHNWKETSAHSTTYKVALKAAKAEQKKAKKVGFEWNTIGGKKGLLAKAKKLQKKGDERGAIKLLKIAKAHAILGQKQARDQVNAGPNF